MTAHTPIIATSRADAPRALVQFSVPLFLDGMWFHDMDVEACAYRDVLGEWDIESIILLGDKTEFAPIVMDRHGAARTLSGFLAEAVFAEVHRNKELQDKIEEALMDVERGWTR